MCVRERQTERVCVFTHSGEGASPVNHISQCIQEAIDQVHLARNEESLPASFRFLFLHPLSLKEPSVPRGVRQLWPSAPRTVTR